MTTRHQHSPPTLARQIGFNSLWLLIARVSSQLLLLLFTILIARNLGETGLGQYAFIASILFVGNVATTFGLDTMIIRELASEDGRAAVLASPLLTTGLLIQIGLSFLFVVATWLVAPYLPNQTAETILALRLAVLSLFPLALSTIYSAVLRAYERMDLYLVFNVITAAVMVASAFIALRNGGALIAISIVIVVAQSAGALGAALLANALVPGFHWQMAGPSASFVRRMTRMGLVLALLMVLGVLYQRLAVMLLSLQQGDAVTGWFSAAARLSEAAKLIPAAFFGAAFPLMARLNAGARLAGATTAPGVPMPPGERDGETQAGKRLFSHIYRYLLLVSVLVAALLFALAGYIIPLLYGPGYEPSILVLRILAWGLPFTVIAVRLSFELVSSGQDRAALVAMSVTLLVALPLMLVSVDRWGLTGASLTTVVAEGFQVLVLLVVTRLAQPAPLPGTMPESSSEL